MANSAVPLFQQKLITYAQAPIGGVTYTTTGQNIDFIVPYGVKNVSIVCLGGGGAISKVWWDTGEGGRSQWSPKNNRNLWSDIGVTYNYGGASNPAGGLTLQGFIQVCQSGNGGGLSYVNNLAVTPGQVLTVRVGDGSVSPEQSVRTAGDSSVTTNGTIVCLARGGGYANKLATTYESYAQGFNSAAGIGNVRRDGGLAGYTAWVIARYRFDFSNYYTENALYVAGGGGAAGYSGNGGNGGYVHGGVISGTFTAVRRTAPTNGQGGGGGGGDHTNPGNLFPVQRTARSGSGSAQPDNLYVGPYNNGYTFWGATPASSALANYIYNYVETQTEIGSSATAGEIYEDGIKGGGIGFNGEGTNGVTSAVSGTHTPGQISWVFTDGLTYTEFGWPGRWYFPNWGSGYYVARNQFTTGAVFDGTINPGSGGNQITYGGGAAPTPKTWYGFDLDGPWNSSLDRTNGIPSPNRTTATALGGSGFVRIMWGNLRSYPSTRTSSTYD